MSNSITNASSSFLKHESPSGEVTSGTKEWLGTMRDIDYIDI